MKRQYSSGKEGTEMAYLTCKNLTLGYEGHAIVSDLNFKVGKGDYLCIVGENGTGKSTLIKTLLHLQLSLIHISEPTRRS